MQSPNLAPAASTAPAHPSHSTRRGPTRAPALVLVGALVLTALAGSASALSSLTSLPSSLENNFNNFLGMVVSRTPADLAEARAQKKINKITSKAFRGDRSPIRCVKDIVKLLKVAGDEFDDVSGVAAARLEVLYELRDATEGTLLVFALFSSSPDVEVLPPGATRKAEVAIAQFETAKTEISDAAANAESDPDGARAGLLRAAARLVNSLELIEQASKRLRRANPGASPSGG